MIVAAQTLSQAEPKQCRLLGATVKGLGLIVAVTTTLPFGYAVVEGDDKATRLVRFTALQREDVMFPLEPQPYTVGTERVAFNMWDEVYSLIPAAQPVVLAVAA